MEAGNGMPFQLRQLLCMSTSFKMLGKSCKCSFNEIGLSATSKHIPAAPKCLFAMGLSGDCVNRSAFKGTCQEKFRSSTRQWHWNAAFSKTVTYIKPRKKDSNSWFLLCGGHISPSRLLTFWYLGAWGSLQRLHKQATNRSMFPAGMLEDGLLVGEPTFEAFYSISHLPGTPSWLCLHQLPRLERRCSAEPPRGSSTGV